MSGRVAVGEVTQEVGRPSPPPQPSPLRLSPRGRELDLKLTPDRPFLALASQFADGGFYVKSKLETVARDILNDQFAKDEAGKKESGEAAEKLAPLSEDDIKYLVRGLPSSAAPCPLVGWS